MDLLIAIAIAAINGYHLRPEVSKSSKHKHYLSKDDPRRCEECEDNHGKIYLIRETPDPNPPIHQNCRCVIELMQAIKAGTATIRGLDGADWALKYNGVLPDCYISLQDLKSLGWKKSKFVSHYATDKLLTKGVYQNRNGHLPQAENRIWYEADINYTPGKRNSQRILWSNDRLIFVTYDHYETFYEII